MKTAQSSTGGGYNVFSKFVIDADKNIIPGNEIMVVNESDDLLAVGKPFMAREEMLTFKRGIAMKVGDGILSQWYSELRKDLSGNTELFVYA